MYIQLTKSFCTVTEYTICLALHIYSHYIFLLEHTKTIQPTVTV